MSRLTRDGTAQPVSRDQILRHARGQGNINFPCSVDHEQDWQPYPVDPYSAIIYVMVLHTYIHLSHSTWPFFLSHSTCPFFMQVLHLPARLMLCSLSEGDNITITSLLLIVIVQTIH